MPIVAMTANALAGDRERCIAAGMDDYVRKPVNPDELLATVRRWAPSANRGGMVGPAIPVLSVLDRTQLLEACGGDEELAEEITAEFASTAPAAFALVGVAVAENDAVALAAAAHNLKGSCWAIGAAALGDSLQTLESIGKGGTLAPAKEAFQTASRQIAELLQQIAPAAHDQAA